MLEFCKWITANIKYDASVPYGSDDLPATLKNKKGHCGHQLHVFQTMCSLAEIPCKTVVGLNLYRPDGMAALHKIRPDYENAHSWAEILLPGSGWVEIDPGQGDKAYSLPAQLIQNNADYQNYVVWMRVDGQWKIAQWEYRDGKWFSAYGIENVRTYKKLEAN